MATATTRVRRTFIEYPVQPEFMDLSFMEEAEDESLNLRTQSDPTGVNAEFAQPRKVLVPMRRVAEEGGGDAKRAHDASTGASPHGCASEEAQGDGDREEDQGKEGAESEEEEEEDDEEEDEEEEAGLALGNPLARTESVICAPAPARSGGDGSDGPPAAGQCPAGTSMAWGAAVPWNPYLAYNMGYAAPGACAWPCAPQVMMPQMVDESALAPPFGQLHNFHREALQFCTVDQDLRTFTKSKHFHGRLSVVTESKVHKGGQHRYMVQLVGGSLSRADGIGFVFAQRLPCTKDIQKIVSVYLNQQGEIGMRLFSKTEKAQEYVSPLEIGDWIEMSIDLDKQRIKFGVWRWDACAWTPSLQLVSSADFDFSSLAAKSDGAKDTSVGYLACVVKNNGASMRLGS